MNFFDSLKGLFNISKTEEGIEEVFMMRKQAKKKFSFQLEKQLFMSEGEIKEIINIIDAHEKKVDEVKKIFDYSNFSILQQNKFELELKTIEKEMCQEIKGTITAIMRKKADNAKEYFKTHPNFD